LVGELGFDPTFLPVKIAAILASTIVRLDTGRFGYSRSGNVTNGGIWDMADHHALPPYAYRIYRDGQPVSDLLPGQIDVLQWFHRHVPYYSMDNATRHEGYEVREEDKPLTQSRKFGAPGRFTGRAVAVRGRADEPGAV
jgi:hypothetical protein